MKRKEKKRVSKWCNRMKEKKKGNEGKIKRIDVSEENKGKWKIEKSETKMELVREMRSLNYKLRKCTVSHEFKNDKKRLITDVHGWYKDICKKWKKELETWTLTIRIYSQVKEMEFCIEECAMLVIKGWIK